MISLSLFILFITSVVLIWGALMLTTFIFLLLTKDNSKASIIYFVVQESLNFLFLLSYSSNLSGILLMTKMGLSPFYAWIFILTKELTDLQLAWFLSMQKGPMGLVLIKMSNIQTILIILLGIIITVFQMSLVIESKMLLVLSSASSSSWLVLLAFLNRKFETFMLFLLYLALFWVLMMESSFESMNISSMLILVFLSIPLSPLLVLKLYLSTSSTVWFFPISLLIFSSLLMTFSYLSLLTTLVSVQSSLKSLFNIYFMLLTLLLVLFVLI